LAADHEDWLKELPVKDMVEWGWMRAFPTVGARIEEALRYFGVATVAVWRTHYEERVVAFRTSEKLADKPGATAAWLRRGEVDGLTSLWCQGMASWQELGSIDELRAVLMQHKLASQ
jgi:hypothetical protein